MPEMLDKDTIDFLTRFGGGAASALTENLFAAYFTMTPAARGKFPYTRPLPQLPLWNDLIVGGISLAEALIGLGIEDDPLKLLEKMDSGAREQAKEFAKGLRKFGEGGIFYSAPTLTRIMITHNTPHGTLGSPASPVPGQGQSAPQPVAQAIVYKL